MLKSKIILPKTLQINQDYELEGECFTALQYWNPHIGQIITVQDINTMIFRAGIKCLSSKKALIHVFERRKFFNNNGFQIILHQALPEKERMEWIIQKTTELGVHRIIPFKSEKSISLEEREKKQKKTCRWPYIALRASEQCRRQDIPAISPFCTFQESLKAAKDSQIKIILWAKNEKIPSLKKFLGQQIKDHQISIMVGPEGGFTHDEIRLASKEGFTPVQLGSRILRTETASIAILSILQFTLGDMG